MRTKGRLNIVWILALVSGFFALYVNMSPYTQPPPDEVLTLSQSDARKNLPAGTTLSYLQSGVDYYSRNFCPNLNSRRPEFDRLTNSNGINLLFPEGKPRLAGIAFFNRVNLDSTIIYEHARLHLEGQSAVPQRDIIGGLGNGAGYIGQVLAHEMTHIYSYDNTILGPNWSFGSIFGTQCARVFGTRILEEALASAAEVRCQSPEVTLTQMAATVKDFCNTDYGQKICVRELCDKMPVGYCSQQRHLRAAELEPRCAGQEAGIMLPEILPTRGGGA
jgi:hypothetical protein